MKLVSIQDNQYNNYGKQRYQYDSHWVLLFLLPRRELFAPIAPPLFQHECIQASIANSGRIA
jgi:hypothetical protein